MSAQLWHNKTPLFKEAKILGAIKAELQSLQVEFCFMIFSNREIVSFISILIQKSNKNQ